MPAYDEAIDHALGMLHSFLSPHLTYHNVWHTEGDVMIAADRLARMSNVSTEDRRLLSVAAAFHDTGFIACTVGHEDVGCELAGSTLPRYGFSDAQIDQIQHMVLATRVPQQPQTLLEAILADADLDALGRPDLFARQRALRQELAATGEGVVDDRTWLSSQLQFMRSHEFHTRAARTLRSAQKNYNTLMLQRQLSYLSNSNGNGVYHS